MTSSNVPLFVSGQRTRVGHIVARARETRGRVLVRVYDSVNVATTTAAKYNARYIGLKFNVARVDEDADTGPYGVYAVESEASDG